jgi:hypothetical protein
MAALPVGLFISHCLCCSDDEANHNYRPSKRVAPVDALYRSAMHYCRDKQLLFVFSYEKNAVSRIEIGQKFNELSASIVGMAIDGNLFENFKTNLF